jgi:hypothetical protein
MSFFKLSSEIFTTMVSILSFAAVVLLVIGLVGNGFEMRKIRLSVVKDEDLTSKNIFLNKKNWKWYALIVIALILWVISSNPNGSI